MLARRSAIHRLEFHLTRCRKGQPLMINDLDKGQLSEVIVLPLDEAIASRLVTVIVS